MAPEGKPFVIALEEHYYDPELAATFDGPEGRAPEIRRRLDDLGELRLKEMDEAGIDVQVISHGAPSTQRLDPRPPCGWRATPTIASPRRSPPTLTDSPGLRPADPRPQGRSR